MTLKDRLSTVEMSPLAKRGLIVLGLIVAFFAFERVSAFNTELEARQRTLQSQLLQLRAIEQSEDPEALLEMARARVDAFESVFYQEDTIGLNTAKFQVELVSVLETCGADQIVIDIQTSESEEIPRLYILDASVRMNAMLLTASRCLDGLNRAESLLEVDSLRWNMPQQLLLQVRAFALIPEGAGS